jgi:hypothetical protein
LAHVRFLLDFRWERTGARACSGIPAPSACCPTAGDHPVVPRTHKMRPCRYVRFCVPACQDYFIAQFLASGSTVQLNPVPAEFASVSGKIQVMPQQGRSVLSTASRHIAARGWGVAAAAWAVSEVATIHAESGTRLVGPVQIYAGESFQLFRPSPSPNYSNTNKHLK